MTNFWIMFAVALYSAALCFYVGRRSERAYWNKFVNEGELRHITGRRWDEVYGKR